VRQGTTTWRPTQRYINEAQTFEGVSFGEPFPPVALSTLMGFGFLATATANGAVFSQPSLCPQGDSKLALGL
jgi:hypothetical protein